MIDTRTQYILYKERETELMAQIERSRTARERGALAETQVSWIAAAGQWLKARVFSTEEAAAKPAPTHAAS